MLKLSHAAQALTLFGALMLASCTSPETSRDMYKDTPASADKHKVEQPAANKLSERRLAAIKAHGLDKQANPNLMIGLSARDVEQTLGKPSFVRKDKGVQIWQYKSRECILDLFLYGENDHFLVDHSELRGQLLESTGELSCFKQIVMGETS